MVHLPFFFFANIFSTSFFTVEPVWLSGEDRSKFLGICFFFEEAVQHLDISNENVSDNNNNICASFSNLAAVYLLEKNEEKASLCLQAALTSNPTYFPAIRLLIFLYLQNGMTDEALFLLSKQRPMPKATN